ncbi:Conjugative transposon protein TcpC [compost metagenome]
MLIVVPVGTDGKGFNVIEQPFFQPLPDEVRLAAVQDTTDPGLRNSFKENEIKQFLGQFFTSYSQNNVNDMAYLMDQPESLQGLYFFKGLEGFSLYSNGLQTDSYTVKTLALFTEKGTGLYMKQPFTLQIIKQNGKFYVKELKHSIGE